VCELGRSALGLQRRPRQLDRFERRSRLIELPMAAAEVHARVGRLDREPELVEAADALDEELLRGCGFAVQPAETPHPIQEQCAIARIRHVREDPLEQVGRLPERDGPLGLLGGP
jgi:hypothetical protein